MIDPPKRLGCRLTYDAECLYNDWQEIGGCSCHTGCAPCSSCHNEGNPISLEENDEAWEPNYTIEDVYNAWKLKQEKESMSRTEITDKGGSDEWVEVLPTNLNSLIVGQEVKINEVQTRITKLDMSSDNSKVIGFFTARDATYDGKPNNFWGKHSNSGTKVWVKSNTQPVKVEPEKVFKVGKWYKCVDDTSATHALTNGKYYECTWVSPDSTSIGVDSNTMKDSRGWMINRFDINSESDYDPNAKKVVAKDVKESKLGTPKAILEAVNFVHDFKQNDFSITKEEVNMSNQNRVVSVKFFDDDAGLKAENSLVASYEITTRANDAMTVNKLLMREDIAGDIDLHNEVRASTVDATILKNTGNKVFLQPIDFEDLRVEVRQV